VNLIKPFVVQLNLCDYFTFKNFIAEGTSGKVFLGNNNCTHEKVAIKILSLDKLRENQTAPKNLENEIKVHWILNKCTGML